MGAGLRAGRHPGNVALVLFYVLATPWEPDGRLGWLGPVNDVLVLAQFVLPAVLVWFAFPFWALRLAAVQHR